MKLFPCPNESEFELVKMNWQLLLMKDRTATVASFQVIAVCPYVDLPFGKPKQGVLRWKFDTLQQAKAKLEEACKVYWRLGHHLQREPSLMELASCLDYPDSADLQQTLSNERN